MVTKWPPAVSPGPVAALVISRPTNDFGLDNEAIENERVFGYAKDRTASALLNENVVA